MQGLIYETLIFFLMWHPPATSANSHCSLDSNSKNFTLAKGNVIADLEKFFIKWIKAYSMEQNLVSADDLKVWSGIEVNMRILTSVVKVRSNFDVFYLRANFYGNLSSDMEHSFATRGIPYFMSFYNNKVQSNNNRISAVLSFTYDKENNGEYDNSSSTNFDTVYQMATVANAYSTAISTILFDTMSLNSNITLHDILQVLRSAKEKMRLGAAASTPKLGLITPVGGTSKHSICTEGSRGDDKSDARLVGELVDFIYVGPFTCKSEEPMEHCLNNIVVSVRHCEHNLGRNRHRNHSLSIVVSTASLGMDFRTRAQFWCRLSQLAVKNNHQVIMLDEDGFIRDYIDESFNSEEKEQGDMFPPIMSAIIGFTVVLVLVLLLVSFNYSKNQATKSLTKGEIYEFFNGVKGEGSLCWNTTSYNTELEIAIGDMFIDSEHELGSGAFGTVCKGRINGRVEEVAIKMTKKYSENAAALRGLVSEIKVLSYLGCHEHIVGLVGAYTAELENGVLYVLLELCPRGSLEKYLRVMKSPENSDYTVLNDGMHNANEGEGVQHKLTRFCHEIWLGVEFLASKKVVHGDIATRNVLLTSRLQVKIADFGLSRRLYEYTKYVKESQEPLPWKWMSPEALQKMEFTEKSDVWAFGVTMWEIFSFGNSPYAGIAWHLQFPKELLQGLRLQIPDSCPQNIYDVMLKCWSTSPEERPTFAELRPMLNLAPMK